MSASFALEAFLVPLTAGSLLLPVRRPLPARGIDRDGFEVSSMSAMRAVAGNVQAVIAAWLVVLLVRPVFAVALLVLFVVTRRRWMRWADRRRSRFVRSQIPDVLHDVARRLRSGYSAPLAFAEALAVHDDLTHVHGRTPRREGERSSASAARQLLNQGEPLPVVVKKWRDDVANLCGPSVLNDLVVAVELAESVGGLRANALEAIADTATEQQTLVDETNAQASQAKASAMVMTIAPVLFCAQMVLRDPDASRLLLRTPIGWVLMIIGGSLDTLAWLWIRRLTSGRRVASGVALGLAGGWPSASASPRLAVALTRCQALVRWSVTGRPTGGDRLERGAREAAPEPIVADRSLLLAVCEPAERAIARLMAAVGLPSSVFETVFGPVSVDRTRRLGIGVAVVPVLLVVRPLLGGAALVVLLVGPSVHRLRVTRRDRSRRQQETAQTIELVRLALESGASPSLALIAVAQLAGPALQIPLRRGADDLRNGGSIDSVARRLAGDAPELRALCDVLVASSRLGLSVGETLRGLAVEARSARRRVAEAHARRLPVVLLFPVVCLTLPAFVVLTVVPLLLTGLGSLRF